MAYDEALADRVRQALAGRCQAEERAMFGGLAFMVRGHMCCGLTGDRLMARVDPDAYDRLLEEPGAQPMDFTGRPMRGFLFVSGSGISAPARLNVWISRALEFAATRPAKTSSRLAGLKSAKRRGRLRR
jgi:TfoX/Sxy family transcriptional regulator of competence genes